MDYVILKYLHILGAVLMGAGLVGVWIADLRSRQHRDLVRFSEAIRYIAVFYDGVVVPGALLLLFSGGWLIAQYFGGLNFIGIPWLAGMVFLFTHYLDLPMLFLIIALGVIKPTTWEVFFYGALTAIGLASFFTFLIPRIYPWHPNKS